jgi:hypothetical protein
LEKRRNGEVSLKALAAATQAAIVPAVEKRILEVVSWSFSPSDEASKVHDRQRFVGGVLFQPHISGHNLSLSVVVPKIIARNYGLIQAEIEPEINSVT